MGIFNDWCTADLPPEYEVPVGVFLFFCDYYIFERGKYGTGYSGLSKVHNYSTKGRLSTAIFMDLVRFVFRYFRILSLFWQRSFSIVFTEVSPCRI